MAWYIIQKRYMADTIWIAELLPCIVRLWHIFIISFSVWAFLFTKFTKRLWSWTCMGLTSHNTGNIILWVLLGSPSMRLRQCAWEWWLQRINLDFTHTLKLPGFCILYYHILIMFSTNFITFMPNSDIHCFINYITSGVSIFHFLIRPSFSF